MWGEELFIDATKVRANADVDSLVPRWYQQAKAHVAALFAADPDGPPHPEGVGRAAAGEPPPPAMAMVPEGRPGEARHEPIPLLQRGSPEDQAQLAAANRATWRLLEQQRLDPARPSPRGYRRTTDVSVSTTDPDATPMRHHPGDRVALGYHDHYIILAALVWSPRPTCWRTRRCSTCTPRPMTSDTCLHRAWQEVWPR